MKKKKSQYHLNYRDERADILAYTARQAKFIFFIQLFGKMSPKEKKKYWRTYIRNVHCQKVNYEV